MLLMLADRYLDQPETKYASLVLVEIETMIRNSEEYDESFIVHLVYRAVGCPGFV
jgi:hypothetical protein